MTDVTHAPPSKQSRLSALTAVFAVFLALAVVASLATLILVAVQNRANGNRLIDCTTPGGKCFAETQAREAVSVDVINNFTVAVTFCALLGPGPLSEGDFDGFAKCVKMRAEVDR